MNVVHFKNMIGQVIVKITGSELGSASLTFLNSNSYAFNFFHLPDCCESVYIEDICGDINDLIGSPLLIAEEVSNEAREARLDRMSHNESFDPSDLTAEISEQNLPEIHAKFMHVNPPECTESYTWTFYRFATQKGFVTIRWLGQSNGYYSETVNYSEGIV